MEVDTPQQGHHASWLLQHIIAYLPVKDQFIARQVSRNFEGTSSFALWKRPVRIRFCKSRMDDFFLTYLLPKPTQVRFLSFVNVQICLGDICQQRLNLLGEKFGESIRHLSIQLKNERLDLETSLRLKRILNHCSNLVKLSLYTKTSLGSDYVETTEETIDLKPLKYLKEFDGQFSEPDLKLINEIFLKAPVLNSVDIIMDGDLICDTVLLTPPSGALFCQVSTFLEKLQSIRTVKLNIIMVLHEPMRHTTMLKTIANSDVTPSELFIFFIYLPNEISEQEKNDVQNWLEKVTANPTLKKLTIVADSCGSQIEGDLEIQFPNRMPYLQILNLGKPIPFEHPIIKPEVAILPAQIPALHTLMLYDKTNPLNENEVFPGIKTLKYEPRKPGLLFTRPPQPWLTPNAALWAKQFVNLTSLETVVPGGGGGGASIRPILTEMPNLIILKLDFQIRAFDLFGRQLWDAFTGSIRPVMSMTSAFRTVIPRKQLQPAVILYDKTVSGIQNLRNLKILVLSNAPPAIFFAIVHLTATAKITPLLELNLSILQEVRLRFQPASICQRVLEKYHELVRFRIQN